MTKEIIDQLDDQAKLALRILATAHKMGKRSLEIWQIHAAGKIVALLIYGQKTFDKVCDETIEKAVTFVLCTQAINDAMAEENDNAD